MFYLIIFSLIVLAAITKSRKIYCIFVTILFILFVGLRSDMCGQDTPMYEHIYRGFVNKSWTYCWNPYLLEEKPYEIGYFVLQYAVSRFFDFNIFKLVCAILSIAPAGFVIYKYSNRPYISFLVFFMLPIFSVLTMSALRQGIAFGFCMMAFHYSIQRKSKIFFLFCIIAILFHTSSVLFILVYFIHYLRCRRRDNLWIFSIMSVVAVFSFSIFSLLTKYSRIKYEAGAAGGSGMLFFLLMLFFLSYFISEKKKNEILNKYMFYLLFLTILYWLIGMNLAAIFRLAAYTEFFLCLYISNTLFEIQTSSIRNIIMVITLCMCGMIMQKIVINSQAEYPVSPYYFWWEK